MTEAFRKNHLFNGEDLDSASSFADAVTKILSRRYPNFDPAPIEKGFKDIEDAFFGRYADLLACDTPYHDLRHSLDTALLMARMVDGFEITNAGEKPALGVTEASLAVLLALYHDIGFLRKSSESGIQGASLIHDHEQRSVDFMQEYLSQGPFAHLANYAKLIQSTNFSKPIADTLHGLPQQFFTIGQMIGTADLLSQMSGRQYLENCRDFLFQEFRIAGVDRTVSNSGEIVILYASPEDLLRKTPVFYEHVVRIRLEEDFSKVYRHLASHFGGVDPHIQGMQRNLAFLKELIARDDFSSLHRDSIPQMPKASVEQAN